MAVCEACNGKELVLVPEYDFPIPCPICGDLTPFIENYNAKVRALFNTFTFKVDYAIEDFTHYDDTMNGKVKAVRGATEWLKAGGFMLLYGASGRGKTSLARACLHEVNAPTLCIDAETMFDLLREGYEDDQRIPRLDMLGEVTALLIDDLGRPGLKPASAHDTKALRSIVDQRYQRSLPTIITTNLKPTQLAEQYDRTIITRLIRWAKDTIKAYQPDYEGSGVLTMGGSEL